MHSLFPQKEDFVQFLSNPREISNPPATPKDEQWAIDASILKLNDKNFKDELGKNDIVLVMFYAPCKYIIEFLLSLDQLWLVSG